MTHFTLTSKKWIFKLIAIILWLLVWQLTAAWINKPLLVPAPLEVLERISQLVVTNEFWKTVLLSFSRMIVGFLIGTFLGVVFAVLSYVSKICHEILYVPLSVIKATPVASFIILALIWLKSSFLSSFITMLMVTPIVWTNVFEGLNSVDKKLLEMAKVFEFSFFKKIKLIFVGCVKPYFLASVMTACGLGWKAGIAAEVIAKPKNAIGTFLNDSKVYLETTDLFAWTVVVVVVSVILERLIKYAVKKIGKGGVKK